MDVNEIGLSIMKDPLFLSKLTFGERLTYYRECRHLSKSELAKKINRHHTLIGKYETGEKKPSLDALFSLSKVLAVHPLDLLYGLPFFSIDTEDGIYFVSYFPNYFDKKGNLKKIYNTKTSEEYNKLNKLFKTGNVEEINAIIHGFIESKDYNSLLALNNFAKSLKERKTKKTKKMLEQLASEILNKSI